ncbi:MAG TPA: hypothetical protein PKK59_04875 [Anaerolineaceae bacterium]|nr:hypothetical protein [Anaerolineaceae bacterium]
MNRRSFRTLIILIIVLFLTSLACGSSDNVSTKVGEVETEPTKQNATEPPAAPVATEAPTEAVKLQDKYMVGDIISLPSQIIVLTGAEFKGNLLVADFVIGNTSNEFLNISSLVSFSARSADGTTLEQEWFDCGPSVDGELAPGDKLKGKICWKNATPGTKIYYEANLFSSGAVIWEVNESIPTTGAAIPEIDNLSLTVETKGIGTEVALNGETIILNSAAINNGLLTANFTVKNTGTEEINVSSMVSFSARAADGTKLEQEIFDCGTGPDGSVQPADLIRGDICWKNASSGTKIYYQSGFLSSQYVIWIIN